MLADLERATTAWTAEAAHQAEANGEVADPSAAASTEEDDGTGPTTVGELLKSLSGGSSEATKPSHTWTAKLTLRGHLVGG